MSDNQLIITLIAVAALLIVAYVMAVLIRKRNSSRLAALEQRKEELYNLPVNDEVEAVKNMHLIGQSQVAFREWNQKWVDLSLNSFADIENNLFEAEGFNNSFRFLKARQQIEQIESQISLIEEDIDSIRKALADLEKQESKNSGRVLHALDLFESLQKTVAEDSEKYGFYLIDLNRMKFRKKLDFNARMKNVSRMMEDKEYVEIFSKYYSELYKKPYSEVYDKLYGYINRHKIYVAVKDNTRTFRYFFKRKKR